MKKKRRFRVFCRVTQLLTLISFPAYVFGVEIVHEFLPFQAGSNPRSPLTYDGDKLYGVGGGPGNFGGIYALDPDDLQFSEVHAFGGGLLGTNPIGRIIPVDSKLFGVTQFGGVDNFGTVFSVDKDGSNFQSLHSFTGGPGDGATPRAGLTLVDDTLYGTTSGGGEWQSGAVFSLKTDGSDYQLLHSFGYVAQDGRRPAAPLTFDGSTLYGTTEVGGSSVGFVGSGSIYAIDPDGDNYRTVYAMGTGGSNENDPRAPVTVVGSTIFGTTWSGGLGAGGEGTVFSVETDGSDFRVLHAFSIPNAVEGRLISGSVALAGSRLYGAAFSGTAEVQGTIFSLLTDGSDFRVDHAFAGSPVDGAWPLAGLTRVGPALYGTTQIGGEHNEGVIFRIVVPEPASFAVAASALLALFGMRQREERLLDASRRRRRVGAITATASVPGPRRACDST